MNLDLLEQKLKKIHSELSESTKKLEETAQNIYQKVSDQGEFDEISESNAKREYYSFLSEAEKNFPGSLKKQCIPENPELWRLENFEAFLKARRKILAEELNSFLKGLAEPVDVSSEVTIEELLTYGESNELEFKSTLRWNLESKQTDKNIEKAISKTIAAFSNADGGVLIIGVEDEWSYLHMEISTTLVYI